MSRFQFAIILLLAAIALAVFCLIGLSATLLLQPANRSAPAQPAALPAAPPASTEPVVPTPEPTVTPKPTKTPRPTATPKPLRWEGSGGDVGEFKTNVTGAVIFSGWHIGDSNFIVTVYAPDGSPIGVPINCIGDCEDAGVVTIYQTGVHLVEVTADSSWAITITNP